METEIGDDEDDDVSDRVISRSHVSDFSSIEIKQ